MTRTAARTDGTDDPRRRVPRTDAVLTDPRVAPASQRLGRPRVKEAVVAAQARARAGEIAPEAVVEEVLATLPELAASLRPVINASGVLLHTNLGRAPLSRRGPRRRRRRRGDDGRRARPRDRRAGPSRGGGAGRAGGGGTRRGRGARREQRGRGPRPRRHRARRRAGDRHRPRRDGRDRRRVPAAGPARVHGRAAARGRHHEPRAPPRLRRRRGPGHRDDPQGPPVELPRHRVHLVGADRRAHRARGARRRGHRVGPARARPGPARRARRRDRAARRRGPGDGLGRQAARRAAGGAAAGRRPSWCTGCAATRSPGRCAWTS